MFTLIMREIEDNRVFFIAAVILAVIFSTLVVWQQFSTEAEYAKSVIVSLGYVISVVAMLGFCAMGAAQMYWDRTRKVSALLATLAVNRNQIFIARVIAGVLLVVIGFVPLAVTIIMAVSNEVGAKMPIHSGFYPEILIPVFLLGFACYCVGLQAGWTSNRIIPTIGAMGLSIILISAFAVKGFGWEIYAILILFIAAAVIRAWRTFSSAAL